MQKNALSDYIDSILCFAAMFVLAITVFNFFKLPLWLNLVAAFSCALILTALFILAFKGKKKKADKDERLYLNQFLFGGEELALARLARALDGRLEDGAIRKDGICYFAAAGGDKLKADELGAMYRKCGGSERLVIYALSGASEQAKEIAALLPPPAVELKTFSDFYGLLKENGCLPELTLVRPKARKSMKLLAEAALERRRCRGYVFACFALLLGTLFSPYKTYYLIAAALCLVLALVCLCDVMHKKEKNPNKDKT